MEAKLKLANQLCFPVYTLAKEIINHYRPLLENLDLTYPQYLVMLVLWEEQEQTVNQLGEQLKLDSGTLTPLLKRMEQKGLVARTRDTGDERVVNITLTQEGKKLKAKALSVPSQLVASMKVSKNDLLVLKSTIEKILKNYN
ncbi:MarR family winged helix-turn-helix transcriptional regulator [Niastella sp. OAS944]|uniref:MarR family winged helix-turn-helix transcriptional regulator n=1 Tax=Niastella sp. OAS944 TaxID=2664089 RepID=UPI0034966FB6|nr:DNA-binding MarR family transcriptional regulator [Chitinophagaceae bacterium OAS944]